MWHKADMPYRTLDPTKIETTAARLADRVRARFPDSSLLKVSDELTNLTRDLGKDAVTLEHPVWWLRALAIATVIAAAVVFWRVGTLISFDRISGGALDAVQGIEAGINTILFAGAGLYTLVTLEERFKRARALKSLHALRSLIHIIDMHQLTKDPAALSADYVTTIASPKRTLTPAELTRYLDYCSEMLSITGKVAALYAQSISDMGVVEAVNDIEELGSNLSRKIWQKIMLIERV